MTAGIDAMIDRSTIPDGADPAVVDARPRSRRRLALPFLLATGWGLLLGYSTVLLTHEPPLRPEIGTAQAAMSEPGPFEIPPGLSRPARPVWSDISAVPTSQPASESVAVPQQVSNIQTVALDRNSEPATVAAPTTMSAPIERAEYVGIWGPTEAACGKRSRRRGFLPATITAESARAGRTICQFRESRRIGNGWTMAASCNDRGRRWSSQVRLVVDGDHLTWSSAQGASSYVRCRRRDG